MHEVNRDSNEVHRAVIVEDVKPSELKTGAEAAEGAPDENVGKVGRVRRMLQKHPWRSLIVLLAVLAVAAYFIRGILLYEDTDDAQVDGHVMPLSARVNGQVQQVLVIEGEVVHSGDVLVTIDSQDYQIATQQAQANLADSLAMAASSHWNVPITSVTVGSNLDSAKTAVFNADAALKAAAENHESAKAMLAEAQANAAKSDADLERYKQLIAKEEISRQQYDQAVATATANRAAVNSAEAGVQAAEQAIQQAEGKLLQSRNDLQTARTAPDQISLMRAKAQAADAQVLQRRALLSQAELNLGYTVIRSPVTGIIGKKTVEVGQNVSIGQEMVEVIPLDDIWVTANFKETQLAHMGPGQPVAIHVDAYGRVWKGHISNLGGGTGSVFSLLPPENATGNYVKVVQRVPVRIDFDRTTGGEFNSEGLLKPGLSVEPEVRVR
jgi:membrane fusion protein (multidrug efflux system)